MPAPDPTAADVRRAAAAIYPPVCRTRLLASPQLSAIAGGPVYLKLETEQPTGSFKLRGAASKILGLPSGERRRGLVAVSSGNHGRAVAHVAAGAGVPATICLTTRVPEMKVAAIADLGATVEIAGDTQEQAEARARELAAAGMTLVHPFDDPAIIAGQGTVGLEIVDDLHEVGTVLVPLSGGGLAAGIAIAVKDAVPGAQVVGVSQDRGPAMYHSLRAGRVVDVVEDDTLADALAGGLGPENRYTLRLCRRLLDQTVLVAEEEIAAAMGWAYRSHDLIVEGGGAVALAALAAGRPAVAFPAVAVVSGGNIDPAALARLLASDSPRDGTAPPGTA